MTREDQIRVFNWLKKKAEEYGREWADRMKESGEKPEIKQFLHETVAQGKAVASLEIATSALDFEWLKLIETMPWELEIKSALPPEADSPVN